MCWNFRWSFMFGCFLNWNFSGDMIFVSLIFVRYINSYLKIPLALQRVFYFSYLVIVLLYLFFWMILVYLGYASRNLAIKIIPTSIMGSCKWTRKCTGWWRFFVCLHLLISCLHKYINLNCDLLLKMPRLKRDF